MEILDRFVEFEKSVVRFLVGGIVRSPPGHFVLKRICGPFAEPTLYVVYGAFRKVIGPITTKLLPKPIVKILNSAFLLFGQALNLPIIVEPLRECICLFVSEFIGVRFGPEDKADMELFLRLGQAIDNFQVKAVLYGSGRLQDEQNCFFPNALAVGPAIVGASPAASSFYIPSNALFSKRNVQIATTALIMSILSYRNDNEILDCMKAGMFPGVDFYSVHTLGETDLCIFVGNTWAVVCFRGTEMETIRDFCTSSLIEEPDCFDSQKQLQMMDKNNNNSTTSVRLVRRRYYREMKSACGGGEEEGYWTSRRRRYVVGPTCPIPGRTDATVFELVQYLHGKGKKIYTTGHSLGGGLATLLGAYLREHLNVPTAANISFGSPPVSGNEAFTSWFNVHNVHWRFVYGNEFATMAPPMPFTSTVKLYHVNQLVDPQNLTDPNPYVRTYEENKKYLDELWKNWNLIPCFFHHNPILTLRQLQGAKFFGPEP